jgi:hypothetical protein
MEGSIDVIKNIIMYCGKPFIIKICPRNAMFFMVTEIKEASLGQNVIGVVLTPW